MNVRVDRCFNGNNNHTFQLIFKVDGRYYRESVRGEDWTRDIAAEAKDKIASNYGVRRENIRFV
jgi:hypothetical protein